MILSKVVTIRKCDNPEISLNKQYKNIIRWAIVEVQENSLKIALTVME